MVVSYVHVKVKRQQLKTTCKTFQTQDYWSLPGAVSQTKVQAPQMHGCRVLFETSNLSEKCLALTKSKLTEIQIPRDLSQNSKQASFKNPTNTLRKLKASKLQESCTRTHTTHHKHFPTHLFTHMLLKLNYIRRTG